MIRAGLPKREWLKFPQFSAILLLMFAGLILFANGCAKQSTPKTPPAAPEDVYKRQGHVRQARARAFVFHACYLPELKGAA